MNQVVEQLRQTDSFRRWHRLHQGGYLSHLFCQLDLSGACKTAWEIGFFEPDTHLITVFIVLPNGDAEIKPADEVFQKKKEIIEELEIEAIKVTPEQATKTWKEHAEEFFPREQLGSGFVILQTLDHRAVWNFTFITKTLRFVNMKIDAGDGSIKSHQGMSLVQGRDKEQIL